ncbi:hypothetical protein llap_11181 [Limosa lapponica baueri]|uniref:Uncharacterized protein n=1 Tax=Limosa lapponica baueri TaxID=1758121 RepID=A0A2I0TXI0_LIMLA|nr:hypothetical protein llap_11181 [Limosa lapponica baueri]
MVHLHDLEEFPDFKVLSGSIDVAQGSLTQPKGIESLQAMPAIFEIGVRGEERRKEQRPVGLSAGQLTHGDGKISLEEDQLMP